MNIKNLLIASVFLTASVSAAAGEYAPQEFDFNSLTSAEGGARGTVESVREVPLERDRAGLAWVFEHSIRPYTAEELVVTLDDGRSVTVVHSGSVRFSAGQRVRVVPQASGTRVEHSWQARLCACSKKFQP